ncbi:hypothetical protein B0J12DRAFT_411913 [Macrophomina phaseolina]|uniref:Uncharacterized protein n=1 Tax=Macrophomina phaseolina TaxID=35725 RepID=A0ABQ8GJ90_9PEZI|nr:hypothetical protein B0J12DRAFT_411913 [Macrophomina phaseolina]
MVELDRGSAVGFECRKPIPVRARAEGWWWRKLPSGAQTASERAGLTCRVCWANGRAARGRCRHGLTSVKGRRQRRQEAAVPPRKRGPAGSLPAHQTPNTPTTTRCCRRHRPLLPRGPPRRAQPGSRADRDALAPALAAPIGRRASRGRHHRGAGVVFCRLARPAAVAGRQASRFQPHCARRRFANLRLTGPPPRLCVSRVQAPAGPGRPTPTRHFPGSTPARLTRCPRDVTHARSAARSGFLPLFSAIARCACSVRPRQPARDLRLLAGP